MTEWASNICIGITYGVYMKVAPHACINVAYDICMNIACTMYMNTAPIFIYILPKICI